MNRKTPIEFFNVSFLDVITSTGGVFMFLVLIFLGALFLNTVLDGKDKLSILWSKNIAYQDSINRIEKDILVTTLKIDSISSQNKTIYSKLKIYNSNAPIEDSRERIANLREILKEKNDSIELLESLSVDINDKLEGLTSEIPQSNKLSYLKPSFDLDTTYAGWGLLVLIKNDSIYLMNSTSDFDYFDWWTTNNKKTQIGRPKKGAGIPINKATDENSDFVKQINRLRSNKIVNVHLYAESIKSYPIVRDYIIKNKKKMSLRFGKGKPELRFSDTGWSPNPIY